MRIIPPGEVERKLIAGYAQAHSRLMGNPARRRANEPTPVPEVRSEPVANNVIPFRRPLDIAGTMQQVAALAVAASPVPAHNPDLPIVGHRLRFIIEHVAAFYRVSLIGLASARRERKIVHPRQVAMYLARKLTVFSLPQIGDRLGGRDHTTILYGARKIEDMLPGDAELAAEVAEIVRRVEAREAVVWVPPDPPAVKRAKMIKKSRLRLVLSPRPKKPPFWDEARDAELIRLWREGFSSDAIGERWGKRRQSINARAKKIGLPPRRVCRRAGVALEAREVPFS
jgi:hypothetical protein